MKTEFTKGDWACSTKIARALVISSQSDLIADCEDNRLRINEQIANAKLIAAALYLLEYGHNLIAKCVKEYDCINITDELYNLTQAIKKATS